MFTGIGLVAFVCIFGTGLAGLWVGKALPEAQRSDATQKTVQMMMNIVGLLSALVLGLLVADAKTNFDTRSKEIEQFAVNLTLLDRELQDGAPDATGARPMLRAFIERKIAITWPKARGVEPVTGDPTTIRMLDQIEASLRDLAPQTDAQRLRRSDMLQIIGELKRTSRTLAVQQAVRSPRPFLIILIFWLSMLFLSYAVFAELNAAVVAAMAIAALSIATAMNLTSDMSQPFSGFVRVSAAPMEQALDQMKPP